MFSLLSTDWEHQEHPHVFSKFSARPPYMQLGPSLEMQILALNKFTQALWKVADIGNQELEEKTEHWFLKQYLTHTEKE